jgi:hypothetical protein
MRRLTIAAVILFLAGALPSIAEAQMGLFLGGGMTIPQGDYAEYAKTGYILGGGVNIMLGESGTGMFAEGFYGSNGHDPHTVDPDEKTNIYGGYLGLSYRVGDQTAPGLFLTGKLGFLNHAFDTGGASVVDEGGNWGFSYGFGAGFIYPGDTVSPWILGQYVGAPMDNDVEGESSTNFFPITVGISIKGIGD